jgi:DNA-binding response OmpR family regulator
MPMALELNGLRVLLVEDVFEVRQITRWMLEAKGAMVVEASTGCEGLRLVRTQTFDVVLTDLGLPDMSGEAVVRGLRSESGGRTPVVVVSGEDAQALSHALELGAERAFGKPVDWRGLLRYLFDKREAAFARNGSLRESRTGRTVLVVDDDIEMRALLCDALEVAGHRAIGQADGRDLPYLVEREPFDAVILDKELPGPDGLDLLSFLSKRLPAVPVILVTAFGGAGVAAEAASRGAYAYLEKPFRIASLLSTLASVSSPRRGMGSCS